jgi:hypothetical protein
MPDGNDNALYGYKSNETNLTPDTAKSACVAPKKGFVLSFDRRATVQESTNNCSSSNYIKYNMIDFMSTN